jgi:primosomal protein N' (replication factor Y)
MPTFVEVELDDKLPKPLDYLVPEELTPHLRIGMRVEVFVKKTIRKGTISLIKDHSPFPKVKPIAKLLEEHAALSKPLWDLSRWMSKYYVAPLQKILKLFVPANIRNDQKEKLRLCASLIISKQEAVRHCESFRTTRPDASLVLDELMNAKKGRLTSELLKNPQILPKTLQFLQKQKILEIQKIKHQDSLLLEEEFFQVEPKILNEEQKIAVEAIQESLAKQKFAAHLVYGITGSGKTEVYLQTIASTLAQGKSALLLIPEVSLTSQTIERFKSRFPHKVAILNHKRSVGEKSSNWESLQKGDIQLAIGARSAIFAPIQNLGLIIIDEEHDSSYKQSDESPCYHGRNVAIMRAFLEPCVVVLGSATPSIESFYNAQIGKFRLHKLQKRAANSQLAKVTVVDMKDTYEKQGGFTHFSSLLLDGIKERVAQGEQILLFLNRRGYHRSQICAACRTIVKCPHCDLALTFHREENILRCHLCDYAQERSKQCASCKAIESLEFKGFGTEHVERSLHAIFPEIRTLRMDRDTTKKTTSHEDLFKQFRSHKADVLIGTQMIAKGFDFPSVTLVGVLNADASLMIPDFRSAETTFQLLTQVAGRAGRSNLPGEVILQTFLPDHPLIQMAKNQDYTKFYEAEIKERSLFGYPPFTHLIKCLFSAPEAPIAEESANLIRTHLAAQIGNLGKVLPVTPAGHLKIKDLYRFQFLIKATRIDPIAKLLTALPETKAKLKIDIDPVSTF